MVFSLLTHTCRVLLMLVINWKDLLRIVTLEDISVSTPSYLFNILPEFYDAKTPAQVRELPILGFRTCFVEECRIRADDILTVRRRVLDPVSRVPDTDYVEYGSMLNLPRSLDKLTPMYSKRMQK